MNICSLCVQAHHARAKASLAPRGVPRAVKKPISGGGKYACIYACTYIRYRYRRIYVLSVYRRTKRAP